MQNQFMPNGYQKRKAKLIAGTLVLAAVANDTPFTKLADLAARMSEAQWRTVSFQAGVAVADKPARVLCVAMLMGLAS